ncbi:hypothetical protein Asppvi_005730 [Aspergillus pseudoviridinutans]|uniref:Uncharacterized protein n=1 Tax=Aspergillus pseudoviridinutans TaxID=1517512 RepID=A0A9P3BF80_9EURO|nr:uncharacterized protein Asppvi_005730 [Aspergillus pseudoviridinutans]GIJ86834.1 hypothetical protein Asppvi_005730 [Aspergillus pseudoviridinutans]
MLRALWGERRIQSGLPSTSATRDLHEVSLGDIERWTEAHEVQQTIANSGEAQHLDSNWEARFNAVDGHRALYHRDLHHLNEHLPSNVSGFQTVARLANKGWITIAKSAICGAIRVASFATQPAGTEFVTEHVLDKQSLRNYPEYMTK